MWCCGLCDIVVGVCLTYAASVLVTGVSQDLDQFDEQVGKIAALIRKEEDYHFHLLSIYADYVQRQEEASLFNSLEVLEDISLHSSFDKVGIVNEDGAGYFVNGKSIYIDPAKMKDVLLCSGAQLPLNSEVSENTIIFGVPYYRAGQSAGMIFGVVNLQTAIATIQSEVLESLQAVYLINDQGETLVKYNITGEVLDYSYVSKNQFYEKEKWVQSKDLLQRAILQFLFHDKNASEVEMMQLISDEGLIWYKHQIAKHIGPGLTLLVVRKACMSPEIRRLFTHTTRTASTLSIIFFCFFIVMLISNRLAQRRLGRLAYMDIVTEGDNWNKLKQDAKRLIKKDVIVSMR